VKLPLFLKNKCLTIHNQIKCLHNPNAAIFILEKLFAEKNKGPVVECGCFQGGMTAKLSVVCKHLNKQLFVFDSFEGLPYEEKAEFLHPKKKKFHIFKKGKFACPLEKVKANIKKHGKVGVCTFVKGKFANTLNNYSNIKPSFVIIDVDLVRSAKECIKTFYPQLRGEYFFTHETMWRSFVSSITNPKWWREELNSPVPRFVYGKNLPMNDCWGYFKKPQKRFAIYL